MASNDNPWGGSAGADYPKKSGGSGSNLSSTVSEKFGRTKEVAAAGVDKTKVVASAGFEKTKVAAKSVKDGASAGVNWLKLKYNKSKIFQKK